MAASPSPSPDVDESVSIGSVLDGRYRIDAVLGSGGMGRVYRGEHTGIGRAVAIKVLHADLGRNREATARFQREALASGRLDHPNIVGVSDFGVLDDGACFLVMEALEGESLGERLEREKRIHWREAVAIMRGVLSGLAHAHDRGVVHRDIKPDNIFLARKEKDLIVKILDFGIAKLAAGSGDDPASTRAGLTVGTPAYLSPEQAVGGEITPASDLYSSTIVLFEMLAGRPPFAEKEPLAMLGAHVSRTPPTVHEVAPDVELPPGLEALLQHGLVKTSADRIASAAQFIAALDSICATVQPYGSAPVSVPVYMAVDLSGGHSITPIPVPAPLGVMPTESLTPIPIPTPLPGSLSAQMAAPHYPTPVPGALTMTPMPGIAQPPVSGAAPTALLEAAPHVSAQRAVALPPAPALPRHWKIVAIVIAAAVVLAIMVVLSGDGDKQPTGNGKGSDAKVIDVEEKGSAKKPSKDEPKSVAPKPDDKKPDAASVEPPPPVEPPVDEVDHATKFKAALHDLQTGKTCAIRKAGLAKLRELGDPKAIPHIKRAKYRMRGGVLGIGSDNTNSCLSRDADAAIKALTPPKQPPKRN